MSVLRSIVSLRSFNKEEYKACYCHVSQNLEDLMRDWHDPMERFRGIECRCFAAEAFAHHTAPVSLV